MSRKVRFGFSDSHDKLILGPSLEGASLLVTNTNLHMTDHDDRDIDEFLSLYI